MKYVQLYNLGHLISTSSSTNTITHTNTVAAVNLKMMHQYLQSSSNWENHGSRLPFYQPRAPLNPPVQQNHCVTLEGIEYHFKGLLSRSLGSCRKCIRITRLHLKDVINQNCGLTLRLQCSILIFNFFKVLLRNSKLPHQCSHHFLHISKNKTESLNQTLRIGLSANLTMCNSFLPRLPLNLFIYATEHCFS